ncbi:retropepsin-like aspartic protease family protein [Falsirhodobacter xinxiangensis]|uniref:retropepsin-like aspartic protease family protein n=1 Tax=Falsirhodobacter xinxiangensis TaxID=2530049 RepID=UPI0010AB330D|nr:TIGR02281 family clan AA aspartic protease [Rhodobacter xinxiangensis]
MESFDIGRLGYLALLLVAVGGWIIVEYRGRLGVALRTGMAWGLIFLGVAAGYGLWQDMGLSIAPRQAVLQSGEVSIPRSPDGHYYVTLEVEGTPITFLADTGATSVVLSQADAQRLGIDTGTLNYLGTAYTANGPVKTARVQLRDVTLGPLTDPVLEAFVNDGEMDGSLLGMSYLGQFRVEIGGDKMILKR